MACKPETSKLFVDDPAYRDSIFAWAMTDVAKDGLYVHGCLFRCLPSLDGRHAWDVQLGDLETKTAPLWLPWRTLVGRKTKAEELVATLPPDALFHHFVQRCVHNQHVLCQREAAEEELVQLVPRNGNALE